MKTLNTSTNLLKTSIRSAFTFAATLGLALSLSSCGASVEEQAPAATPIAKPVAFVETPHPELHDLNDHAGDAPDSLTAAAGIHVLKARTCTGIEQYEPVGEGTEFSTEVGRVYLYTKIGMPAGETGKIKHVWKLEGKEISTVELDVRGPNFRTRSYKTITEKLKGNWTVDVLDAGGKLLETTAFVIE